MLRVAHGAWLDGTMITRYEQAAISAIWCEENKLRLWTQIERAHLAEAASVHEKKTGVALEVPHVAPPSPGDVDPYEARVGHDVGGFLLWMEDALPADPPFFRNRLHYGLTSSDLVDTANAMRINRTHRTLRSFDDALRVAIAGVDGSLIAGRTHGQIASPTTLRRRWAAALAGVHRFVPDAPAMFTGAVGMSLFLDRYYQERLATRLGLKAAHKTTQVIPRQRFNHHLYSWLTLTQACEQIATDVRLMAALGDTVPHPDHVHQVGSSAMPGKVNPIKAERICGLARYARGLFAAALESSTLWLDRDLTHSAPDRLVFPDLAHVALTCLRDTIDLVERVVLDPDADVTDGRFVPADVELATLLDVNPALSRSEAYERVRLNRTLLGDGWVPIGYTTTSPIGDK